MSGSIDVLSITTPLPDTSFEITGLNGYEALSTAFSYTVFLQSGSALLDPNKLLDNPVTVTIGDPTTHGRYVNGIVRAVAQMPQKSADLWNYQIVIVPKFWFLDQTQDCRFFHSLNVPQVVEAVLGKFGVKYTNKLQGTYATRDYVVQFNESYLQFVQRLCEAEGIFYFFTHDDSSHTLILADTNTVFTPIVNATIEMSHTGGGMDTLSDWHRQDSTALGQVRVDDYNPKFDQTAPGTYTSTQSTVLKASGASQRTHYHWPAGRGGQDVSTNRSDDAIDGRAKWRIEAAEAAAQGFVGHGHVKSFYAGGKFTLKNDPTASGGSNDYVMRSVAYSLSDTATNAGGGGSSQVSMSCQAFLATTTFRALPTVRPPVMAGLYTAQVIGPAGEEIYTDDLGRIKVQFPWDNAGDITADNTFWARVVHPWGGSAWGVQFTPRVGMEVVVAFMEGDVNRPVVVGSIYNNAHTPVFAASDKNKSGFRTHSTKGGGSSNFNELSFDDTMGSEVFYLHAEKDQTIEVENDQTITVDHDQTETVKHDQTLTVNHDRSVTVDNDETITIQGKQTQTITGNRTVEITSGNDKLTVDDGTITYEASDTITFKVGDNSIVINQQGITISAMQVQISAETQLQMAGKLQTSVGGQLVQVNADMLLNLKGGVTMVNS